MAMARDVSVHTLFGVMGQLILPVFGLHVCALWLLLPLHVVRKLLFTVLKNPSLESWKGGLWPSS
jgi:hypothetical protein